MTMDDPVTITSFVIRFIQSGDKKASKWGAKALCRGAIRHVQSNQEHNFTRWSEAVDFIQKFVALGESNLTDDPDANVPEASNAGA